MTITLNIPDEFAEDYTRDRFKEFFERVTADIKDGTCCGNYEQETCSMLEKAFAESTCEQKGA